MNKKRLVKKLQVLYQRFFRKLAIIGKKSFREDPKCYLLRKGDCLSKKQILDTKQYWNQYTKDFTIDYHKYYTNRTGIFNVRYIPDDIFAGYIDPYLNNRQTESGIANKNYFDLYLNSFEMPTTFVRYINGCYLSKDYELISQNDAVKRLLSKKSFVVKPSTASFGGKNVKIFNNSTKQNIEIFLDANRDTDLIFQSVIEQSLDVAILHEKSINTVRVVTLLINSEIKVLNTILRIGVGDSYVDNASAGGLFCAIDINGSLANVAYDGLGNKYDKHPDGHNFSECRITCMNEIKEQVKRAAQILPNFRLIGWDIAINKNNKPIIIEANLTMTSVDIMQLACGPIFAEYTESVLKEVFNKNNKNNCSMDMEQYI